MPAFGVIIGPNVLIENGPFFGGPNISINPVYPHVRKKLSDHFLVVLLPM
jgi:hypothetical protein